MYQYTYEFTFFLISTYIYIYIVYIYVYFKKIYSSMVSSLNLQERQILPGFPDQWLL